MKWVKSNFVEVLLVLISLSGLCIMLYPAVSNYWNSFHQSRAIADYEETVAVMDNEKSQQFLEAAQAYNDKLARQQTTHELSEEELAEYEKQLDISGLGIMGYIDIPKINCSLPIYHGTDESVLQIAAGHIEWSSLPVGGESTHCVISGHSGLSSAKLFTDLDSLEIGDIFLITVLTETLTYEVDQIQVVLPENVEDLKIIEGEDLCTLITCTPYGINSHRLLVRGHRIPNREDTQETGVTSGVTMQMLLAALAAVALLMICVIVILRKRKQEEENHKNEA